MRGVVAVAVLVTIGLFARPGSQVLGAAAVGAAGGGPAATGDGYLPTAKIIGGGRGCTGVLVHPEWVLTAKRCFAAQEPAGPPATATTAVVGRLDLASAAGLATTVIDIVPRADRDVVLARLATPATQVPVATIGAAPAVGETLRGAGYGRTATEWVPAALHATDLTVQAVGATSIDVVGVDPRQPGICKGDAGGPAFRELAGGAFELVAIHSASWQGGCLAESETRREAVEARVDDLAGWIRQATAVQPRGVERFAVGGFVGGEDDDDLLGIDPVSGKLWLYPGTSESRRFAERVEAGRAGWGVMTVLAAGDFNNDGRDDLVAVDGGTGRLWLYPGTAATVLGPRVELGRAGWAAMSELAVGRFNQDAHDDLLAIEATTGKLWLYPGTGAGALGARAEIGRSGWTVMTELTAGSIDPGDTDDLLAYDGDAERLWLYPGTGAIPPNTLGPRLPMD